MKPHVHPFSVWVYTSAWIFPSNSLLVEVSPASCDLTSLTSIIWTPLFPELRGVVPEGMPGVPLWAPERGCELPKMIPRKLRQQSGLLTATLVLFPLCHLGPCLLMHQRWEYRFYKNSSSSCGRAGCTALFDTHFLPDPFLLLIRAGSTDIYQKTLLVSLHLPHQNATPLSCLEPNTICKGPLLPAETSCCPSNWKPRVFTLKILRVCWDFQVGHTPSSCHPIYYVFGWRLFCLEIMSLFQTKIQSLVGQMHKQVSDSEWLLRRGRLSPAVSRSLLSCLMHSRILYY